MTVSRKQALKVKCPECEAEQGQLCKGARDKVRLSFHSERGRAARKAFAAGSKPFDPAVAQRESIEAAERLAGLR